MQDAQVTKSLKIIAWCRVWEWTNAIQENRDLQIFGKRYDVHNNNCT